MQTVAGLAPGQGQGTNPAVGIATQVGLVCKTAPAAAERLTNGVVFVSRQQVAADHPAQVALPVAHEPPVIGLLLFTHSTMDRAIRTGLKRLDSF